MEGLATAALRLITSEALPVVILILLAYHIFNMNKLIERMEKSINVLKERLEELEIRKLDKEQYLQDISGWRWEIQRLEDRMEKFFDRLTELIQVLGGKQ